MAILRRACLLITASLCAGRVLGSDHTASHRPLPKVEGCCSTPGPAQSEAEVERAEEKEAAVLDVRLLQTRIKQPIGTEKGLPTLERLLEVEENAEVPAVSFLDIGEVELFTGSNLVAKPKHNISEEKGVCWSFEDCCPEEEDGDTCKMFCQEGTEIDTHDAKGWEVKGQCTKKWDGYCTEDEQCYPGNICQRTAGSLHGVCMRDIVCDTMSCGRGHCRWGKCTCNYGVKGERCDQSLEAFAFLFYGNSSENLISVRVLVRSMRAAGAQQDILAIIPTNMAWTVPQTYLDILQEDGVKLWYSDPIPMPASMDADPIIHKRWSGVMNKFAVWRLTNYSQVALLDTDMVYAFDSEAPDQIFAECNAPLCAVRDGDSRYMNAGVMVIIPSRQRLAHIIQVLSDEQHHFAMPEQQFLTEYCKKLGYKMELQFLDKKWNSCVGGGMLHNTGWESTGYNVLHSCSWTGKPPNMKMCLPGSCDVQQQWHTVLVWQFFHMQADACIRHIEEETCTSAGIGACGWCGHYCSDSRIPCSNKLFNQTYLRDKDEPDIAEAARLDTVNRMIEAEFYPYDRSTGPQWDRLPLGSWAWPQVAMYQVLIDRFASPTEEYCVKLDDYCGGTIQAIRDKLWYIKELGVDGIVMSPIVDQMPKGYHGYWTKDLTTVNPAYGTEDDVKELVLDMHENKMKVFVDVNMNHAGGPGVNASNPRDVAILKPFNKPEYYHSDNCSLIHNEDYDRGAYNLEHCKLYGLPDYNQENPVVWQALMQWARDHVDSYGFDGIRVDAARHMPREFLQHIPDNGPPMPAYFEVVQPELGYVSSYAFGDYGAVYNYPLYFVLNKVFVPGPKQAPMSDLQTWMTDEAPKAEGRLLLNFLDNNDLPRFIYRIGEGGKVPEVAVRALYHNALVCILGMEGLPMLLFGSEQDERGKLNYTDRLKVDNWRPPLWHSGYNTSGDTFQLIEKVLWLRKRSNGLHGFAQIPVYADHQVLVFARGPAIFVVTNTGQPSKMNAQRVIWDNATWGLGPYGQPSLVCNLLAVNPYQDCGIIAPGNISRIHLSGDPKVYVPKNYIGEYQDFVTEKLNQKERWIKSADKNPRILPLSRWAEMPNPPVMTIEAQRRVARSWVPGDVSMNANPDLIWHPFPILPPHLDKWGPPLGMPAPHVVRTMVEDVCFYLGPGEDQSKDGQLVAIRGDSAFILCPDAPEWCLDEQGLNGPFNSQEVKTYLLTNASVVKVKEPVYHMTFDSWYGVYHILISALPSVMPFFSELQAGRMKVFLHQGADVAYPVFNLLGIAKSIMTPPLEDPLTQPYAFCTPELHLTAATRPMGPRAEFNVPDLHLLQKALRNAQGLTNPSPETPGTIVVLSRSGNSRSLSNENELVQSLSTLGRSVEVVSAEPGVFLQTITSLSKAEIIIGGHGANMANMLFAPSGVKVVEIIPQVPYRQHMFHFRDLAAALNLTYVPTGGIVNGTEFDHSEAQVWEVRDKALKMYQADVAKVTALVSSLL